MLKKYFIDLFNRFKAKSIFIKTLFILLILFEIFICFICFYKVDYIVDTPGPLSEASSVIEIDTTNNRGHVLTVAVSEYERIPLIKYWLSKADKRFALEKIEDDYDSSGEYYYSYYARRVSLYNAIIYAYQEAEKVNPEVHLIATYKGVLVAYVKKDAKTTVKADDIITEVNGEKFDDFEGFIDLVSEIRENGKEGDVVNIKVTRVVNNTEQYIDCYTTLSRDSETGSLLFGFSCFDYTVPDSQNSTPKFKISDGAFATTGNSGGAMLTLSIYNALTHEDLLNAKGTDLIIAGTGTINLDGSIGAIGGIEQKVVKAYISGVDAFFVDSYDYDDAIAACEKFGYDSSFIKKATTFNDILNELKRLRGEGNE